MRESGCWLVHAREGESYVCASVCVCLRVFMSVCVPGRRYYHAKYPGMELSEKEALWAKDMCLSLEVLYVCVCVCVCVCVRVCVCVLSRCCSGGGGVGWVERGSEGAGEEGGRLGVFQMRNCACSLPLNSCLCRAMWLNPEEKP